MFFFRLWGEMFLEELDSADVAGCWSGLLFKVLMFEFVFFKTPLKN